MTSVDNDVRAYSDDLDKRLAIARREDQEEEFSGMFGAIEKTNRGMGSIMRAVTRAPKNIGIGALRAAVRTVQTVDDIFEGAGQFISTGDIEPDGPESFDAAEPIQSLFPGAFESVNNFLDEAQQENSVPDDIVQGVSQFAVPFSGYLKAFGGLKNISTLSKLGKLALAEGVTAASAFEAHEGRVADLIVMGKQMDNDFGKVLNKVSPDGSLVNDYINYITDREDESEWEGRFKNAVDSVVTTAGIGAFLKTTAVSLRSARRGFSGLQEKLKAQPKPKVETPKEESTDG